MAQIQFPNPAGQDAAGKDLPPIEYTGISFGIHGGVETFLVIGEGGHLTVMNKAQSAQTQPATGGSPNLSGSGRTGPQTYAPSPGGARVPVR